MKCIKGKEHSFSRSFQSRSSSNLTRYKLFRSNTVTVKEGFKETSFNAPGVAVPERLIIQRL